MSKLKNGALDQYVTEPFEQQIGTAGVEAVNFQLVLASVGFFCDPYLS